MEKQFSPIDPTRTGRGTVKRKKSPRDRLRGSAFDSFVHGTTVFRVQGKLSLSPDGRGEKRKATQCITEWINCSSSFNFSVLCLGYYYVIS